MTAIARNKKSAASLRFSSWTITPDLFELTAR